MRTKRRFPTYTKEVVTSPVASTLLAPNFLGETKRGSAIAHLSQKGANRASMPQNEASLQAQVAQFLRIALPSDAIYHHSPGEGKRGWRAQASLKASGFTPGWPDVEIVWAGNIYFLELKTARGRLTPTQVACHDALRLAGAAVAVARSLDEVATHLLEWGLPLRATL